MPLPGALIILAAGNSERMGSPKALLPCLGTTFLGLILERTFNLKCSDNIHTAVVYGSGISKQLEEPKNLGPFALGHVPGEYLQRVEFLLNPNPSSGPLGSLKIGLKGKAASCAWAMVCHVDHPLVSLDTYQSLAKAGWEGKLLAQPSYLDRPGHPIMFSRGLFNDIFAAPLEAGARWVVSRHYQKRVLIPVPDENVLRNVDTPTDYNRLIMEKNK